MKAWCWISIRRSLGDALTNALEETTMKNIPIDQFRSFKWRNRVQNCNLCEKLSKIGPFENFNFWSKVNAKVKVNEVQSQRVLVKVNGQYSEFPGWAMNRAAEKLTSSYDVALIWLRLTRMCLHGCWHEMITSFSDIRWHQQEFFDAWMECAMSTSAWRRSQKPRWCVEARALVVES